MERLCWSRTADVLRIVVVLMGICAGVCCADVATDGNSILTDGTSENSTDQHTSPPNPGQGGITSEFSTLAMISTLSSKTTTLEKSEITSSHDNPNVSETTETRQQIGDNHADSGKDVATDNDTNDNGEHSENKPTFIKNSAGQRGQNIVAAVGSPEDSEQSKNPVRLIHVILFTSWQMIVAMIGLEVFAYCVTIFIIFGFGRQRSRAKRFGHFSWKRPGPLQLEQETSFSTIMSREHNIGGTQEPLMKVTTHKGMMKKPSIRGHRP